MVGQQKEAKFVNEWLATFHADKLQWKRQRLGPVPLADQSRVFEVLNIWIDAVVKDGDTILLVEAKLKPDVRDCSKLDLDQKQFPQTPMFAEFRDFPTKKIMLVAIDDRLIREFCEDRDIEFIVFRPKFLDALTFT